MTTTRPTDLPVASAPPITFCLPDIPQKHPDDMTSVKYLHEPGQTHHLSQYLGNPEGLNLRAEDGFLGWHDPATGEHIPTLRSQTERAESAETRVKELEAELHRLRAGR